MRARFPSGSIQAAVAEYGDEWLWFLHAPDGGLHPSVRAAPADAVIFRSHSQRLFLLRRDAGRDAQLPRPVRRKA